MPRTCTVCAHPEREAIDKALLSGGNCRGLSALYRVSEDAILRHKNKHLPAAMVQAQGVAEVTHADNLLDQVRDLQRQAKTIKDKAETAGDLRTAIAGIREMSRIIELLAKLQGELQEGQTINVLIASPAWIKTRTAVLKALEGHPEARQAVVKALQAINDN
jgi:hypothetical protein